MTPERVEVLVVGGGPAGFAAAIEAARAGAQVVIVDENARPGGQIYRQLPPEFVVDDLQSSTPEQTMARALFSEADQLSIQFRGATLVWGSFEPRVLEVIAEGRSARIEAKVMIIAAGAYDRPVPLPGWTLPGVLTVGGAQTLLKSQRMLPGKRILLAGTGPLLLVVASQLAKAGANIAAVIDTVPAGALLPHAWSLMKAGRLFKEGIGYRTTLLRAGVRWLAPYVLTRIEGTHAGRQVRSSRGRMTTGIRWSERSVRSRWIQCASVTGSVPSVELLRLLGCRLHHDPLADVWLPDRTGGWGDVPSRRVRRRRRCGGRRSQESLWRRDGSPGCRPPACSAGCLMTTAEQRKRPARQELSRLRPFCAQHVRRVSAASRPARSRHRETRSSAVARR